MVNHNGPKKWRNRGEESSSEEAGTGGNGTMQDG